MWRRQDNCATIPFRKGQNRGKPAVTGTEGSFGAVWWAPAALAAGHIPWWDPVFLLQAASQVCLLWSSWLHSLRGAALFHYMPFPHLKTDTEDLSPVEAEQNGFSRYVLPVDIWCLTVIWNCNYLLIWFMVLLEVKPFWILLFPPFLFHLFHVPILVLTILYKTFFSFWI